MNLPNTQYPRLNTQCVTSNILTVDVEDYFQVSNFRRVVDTSQWDSYESRVVANTEKILKILAQNETKATFFVLGWVAQRYPALVKNIYSQGHEVASHGFWHKSIYAQNRAEFRDDLRKSKKLLEDIISDKVLGYRAPTFSIGKQSLWALDILAEEGFAYDSSFFPFRYEAGGLPDDKRYPHKIYYNGSYLWEVPVSTIRVLKYNLPFSGGGYFRLCPFSIVRRGIKEINKKGAPALVYIHPWEIDPQQPRLRTDWLSSFRHYHNLGGCEVKLRRLLGNFKFIGVKEYLSQQRDSD